MSIKVEISVTLGEKVYSSRKFLKVYSSRKFLNKVDLMYTPYTIVYDSIREMGDRVVDILEKRRLLDRFC